MGVSGRVSSACVCYFRFNVAAGVYSETRCNHCPVRALLICVSLTPPIAPPPPYPTHSPGCVSCCRLNKQLDHTRAQAVPKISTASFDSESNLDWGNRPAVNTAADSVPPGGGAPMARTSSNKLHAPARHTVGTTSQRPRSFHEESSSEPL